MLPKCNLEMYFNINKVKATVDQQNKCYLCNILYTDILFLGQSRRIRATSEGGRTKYTNTPLL